MPRSASPARFPYELHRIVEYFMQNGPEAEGIQVTLEKEDDAKSLRFMWYNFVKALRNSPEGAKTARMAEGVIVRKNGCTLRFESRDNDGIVKALQQAIDKVAGKEEGTMKGLKAVLDIEEFGRQLGEKELFDELFGIKPEDSGGGGEK